MTGSSIDEEDFADFLAKVESVDQAIKGLKDGSVSLADVDAEHSELLELGASSEKREQQQKEKQLRRQIDKQPLATREAAIERVQHAERVGNKELIRLAEDQLRETERRLAKQQEQQQWREARTEVGRPGQGQSSAGQELREEFKLSKQRQERWDLWKAAHPKFAKKYETNYEAWDKWEPTHAIEDHQDELMPDSSSRPELKVTLLLPRLRPGRRWRKTSTSGPGRGGPGSRRATTSRMTGTERSRSSGGCQGPRPAERLGSYQNAIELYGAALSVTPWLVSAFTNRALAQLKLQNWRAAVDDCKEALAVADYNDEPPASELRLKAMKRQAAGYEGLGKWAKAVSTLEAALELCGGEHKDLQKELADTSARWAQFKEEQRLSEQLAAEPESGLGPVEAALAELAAGNEPEKPLELLELRLVGDPEARALFHKAGAGPTVLGLLGGGRDRLGLRVLLGACLNRFNIDQLLSAKLAARKLIAAANSEARLDAFRLLALIAEDDEPASRRALCSECGLVGLLEAQLEAREPELRQTSSRRRPGCCASRTSSLRATWPCSSPGWPARCPSWAGWPGTWSLL